LDEINLSVNEGEIFSILGPSGCGKTTLARTILGFYKPSSGRVLLDGEDVSLKRNQRRLRQKVQIIFQNPFLSVDPRYTVFSTLYETLNVFCKVKRPDALNRIEEVLSQVELSNEVIDRYPHQLSGGQVQRLCIARALINKPPLVICDEPTSSLDITTASKIIKLLKKIQTELGVTFLFISHNLKLLKKISDYSFIMYYGKIVEHGLKELIYSNPVHPYTKLLLEASNQKLKTADLSSFKEKIFKQDCQLREV